MPRGGKRPNAGRKPGSATAPQKAAPEIKESKESKNQKNQTGNQTGRGGARPGAGRRKKAQPPKALDGLKPRHISYLKGLAEGKTKKAAALEAGFSPSAAASPASHIETPPVREAFKKLVQETIPAETIVQKLTEGLDAQETKFFQKDGKVQETRDVIAFGERREYLKLATEYGGYHVPRAELGGEGGGPLQVVIRRIGADLDREPKPPPVQVAVQVRNQVNLPPVNSRPEPKPVVIEDAPIEGDVPLEVNYDANAQVLRVNYRSGAVFEHPEVPGDVYGLLRTAADKGKFYADIIRKGFPGQRVRS